MKYAILAYVLSASAALAHPGHLEAKSEGAAHWLTQADHVAMLCLTIGLASVGLFRMRARQQRSLRE